MQGRIKCVPISPEKKRSGTQVKKEDRLKIPKACFRLKEPVFINDAQKQDLVCEEASR